MLRYSAILAVIMWTSACSHNSSGDVQSLSDEFVYTTLSFSPVTATGTGLHEYKGQHLDDLLDDLSPAGLDHQRQFYAQFRQRLDALPSGSLSPGDRADLSILQDQISLAELDLNEIHSQLHNPTAYVQLLGNAFFNPDVLEYAPKPARLRNIISRLQKTPAFLEQARSNLESAPEIWTK